jgi:drug/metabolite transporter (DMT)-like permease
VLALDLDVTGNVAVFALALGAAVLFAVGFVIQQYAAARAPASERLSLRLLIDLAQRPIWIGGILAMIAGQVLGAFALASGSLTLIEPLEATNLLFALPMSAALARRRIGRREWAGAVSLVAGLATFVAAAGPGGLEVAHVPDHSWLIAGLVTLAVAGGLVGGSKCLQKVRSQAGLLAGAAGILYGLQDALTQRSLFALRRGTGALVTDWQPYSLIIIAIVGLVLAQTAFEMAPLDASLPALTISEPLAGVALGASLFSEKLRLTGPALPLEIVSVVAMIGGVIVLGRSALITGQADISDHSPP